LKDILAIQGLYKQYGKVKAVHSLSLNVTEGSVFGILGPNGSGKSTTLGIILGVTNKDKGGYAWFGGEQNVVARKKIGAILETPSFYPYLSAAKNLGIVAKIKNCPDRSNEILKLVGLYERRNDPFRTFSLGMKQRLSIGAALLADPKVLVLDEPTNGLDPQGIAEIRALIHEISKQGKTILFASHLLDEVEKVCSHFVVLDRGEKVYHGAVEEALQSNVLEVGCPNKEGLRPLLSGMKGIKEVVEQEHYFQLHLSNGLTPEEVNRQLIQKGIVLGHLSMKKNSLEKQFLKILSQNQQSRP